jgi:hypothetical protein
VLVTGDKQLLRLREIAGIPIRSPAEFAAAFLAS